MAKILIIEDNDMLSRAYRMILEKSGHKVGSANDGNEALLAVEEFDPQIILLDLLMPKMGGLEFLRNYDVINKHPDVKVVVLTNMGREEDIKEALELGAYKYIIKAHSSPADLAALVDHLIKKNISLKK